MNFVPRAFRRLVMVMGGKHRWRFFFQGRSFNGAVLEESQMMCCSVDFILNFHICLEHYKIHKLFNFITQFFYIFYYFCLLFFHPFFLEASFDYNF